MDWYDEPLYKIKKMETKNPINDQYHFYIFIIAIVVFYEKKLWNKRQCLADVNKRNILIFENNIHQTIILYISSETVSEPSWSPYTQLDPWLKKYHKQISRLLLILYNDPGIYRQNAFLIPIELKSDNTRHTFIYMGQGNIT